jgi:hypothetical protein
MSEENPHPIALNMTKRRLISMDNAVNVFEVLYTN